MDQLVEKGKQLPDDERRQQKKKKRANQGNQMYFDDTLELVLRNWKN